MDTNHELSAVGHEVVDKIPTIYLLISDCIEFDELADEFDKLGTHELLDRKTSMFSKALNNYKDQADDWQLCEDIISYKLTALAEEVERNKQVGMFSLFSDRIGYSHNGDYGKNVFFELAEKLLVNNEQMTKDQAAEFIKVTIS